MFPERYENTNIATAKTVYRADEQVYLIHDGTDGWIALCKKLKDKFFQRHYKINDVALNLTEWVDFDSYISMNTFYSPKRLVTNLRELRTFYIDLDCYKGKFTPEQVLMMLRADYFGTVIPVPNLIIFSGRGINLIWFIDPISGLAVDRWGRVQKRLLDTLKHLGADKASTDATRVFRLCGSVNSKNNEVVYAELLHEYRYDIKEIVEDYFPELKTAIQPKKKPKKRTGKATVKHLFNEYSLIVTRMEDIVTLVKIRKGEMTGCRELALFLYRYWSISQYNDYEKAIAKTLEVNEMFADPLPFNEVLGDTKSAERYFESDEGFQIKNETIIKWLHITKEEQKNLKTVIDRGEKNRRKREANEQMRRNQGMKSRDEYNVDRKASKEHLLNMLKRLLEQNPKAKRKDLANILGVDASYISKLRKEMEK